MAFSHISQGPEVSLIWEAAAERALGGETVEEFLVETRITL